MQNKTYFAFSVAFLTCAVLTPFAGVGSWQEAATVLCCYVLASLYLVKAFMR